MSAILGSCSRVSHNSNSYFNDLQQQQRIADVDGLNTSSLSQTGTGREYSGTTDTAKIMVSRVQPTCFGCSLLIGDRFVVQIRGRVWHEACAVCTECSADLRDFCFIIDSQLLCKQDYHRRYATKCATCKQPMLSHELCMRAGRSPLDAPGQSHSVHHVSCFVCSVCRVPLAAGDLYTYHATTGALLCQADYIRQTGGTVPDSPAHPDPAVMGGKRSIFQSSYPFHHPDPNNLNQSDAFNAKRGRTTLTYEQRFRFQEVFDDNPRPSRKVRESLANELHLSVRVIQVWFQNQRAREKKLSSSSFNGAVAMTDNNSGNGDGCSRIAITNGQEEEEDASDIQEHSHHLMVTEFHRDGQLSFQSPPQPTHNHQHHSFASGRVSPEEYNQKKHRFIPWSGGDSEHWR